MVKVGTLAPALSGDSTAGKVKLRDLRGQYVVVYFYPKDNTPGCTKEAPIEPVCLAGISGRLSIPDRSVD